MQRAIAVYTRGGWPEDAAVDTVTLAYVDRHRRRIRLGAEPPDLLRIAWHLGNRHLPLQVVGTRLRIRADHVIAEMVAGLGGRVTRLEAPFDPETGAYHAHE